MGRRRRVNGYVGWVSYTYCRGRERDEEDAYTKKERNRRDEIGGI